MIITIDGPAGAGKSTLAKGIAKELGFIYLDTGATYRAVALKIIIDNIDPNDPIACENTALNAIIELKYSPDHELIVMLDNLNVTSDIRNDNVSDMASRISVHPEVRRALVSWQQNFALNKNIVAEGRDIGSVVFPNADIKFFLDAPLDERSHRREKQLLNMGISSKSHDQIKSEIAERDQRDKSRHTSPLICPIDAIYINNATYRKEDTLNAVMTVIESKINSLNQS